MMKKIDYEALFYETLRRIAAYDSPAKIRRFGEQNYGLSDFAETLEMAYENMQEEARSTLKGYRKPKPKSVPPVEGSPS